MKPSVNMYTNLKCLAAATVGILVGGGYWGLMSNPAAAASFQTVIDLDRSDVFDGGGVVIDSLVFDWSGDDSNDDGYLSFSELSDWSISAFSSDGGLLFSDFVVTDGIAARQGAFLGPIQGGDVDIIDFNNATTLWVASSLIIPNVYGYSLLPEDGSPSWVRVSDASWTSYLVTGSDTAAAEVWV